MACYETIYMVSRCFDLACREVLRLSGFSLFGIFLGFENSAIKSATASTDGLMVTWEVPAILKHASGAFGPALPNYCACIKFDSGWACSVQFMFSLILDSQGRGLPCTTLLLSWSRAMEDRHTQPR